MIAGVCLDRAVEACGVTTAKEAGTFSADLFRGLRNLGVRYGRSVSGRRREIPSFALGVIENDRTDWAHAVVVKDGFVYDPAIGERISLWVYETFVINGAYSKRAQARWQKFIPILESK